jgi:hypothetical protein
MWRARGVGALLPEGLSTFDHGVFPRLADIETEKGAPLTLPVPQ